MLDFTSQAVGIPVGLTSDLAQMVKRGAVNEQQARDMMEAKKITAGYFRQSERFIAWVNVIAKFRGCVSMLIAPSKQPVAISAASVNSKPTPPAALPPLTPDLYEMVATGLLSEDEARRMMASAQTGNNGLPLQPSSAALPASTDQTATPLTPQLYEMVTTGVLSEDEARRMLEPPRTAARLAATDEQVWGHTDIHS